MAGAKVVLVVDDEHEICDLISEEIQAEGYTVAIAHSGNEAIRYLKDNPPDMIISDFMMANGTGLDVLEAIEGVQGANKPVFILVTGYAHITADEAVRRGAKHVFSKPVDFDEFFSTIFKYLEAKKLAS